jgi:hypothetical protein
MAHGRLDVFSAHIGGKAADVGRKGEELLIFI